MKGLSRGTIFWHSLRTYLFARICLSVRRRLLRKFSVLGLPKLLTVLALLLGAVVYHVVSWLFDKLLVKMYRLHKLNTQDEFFLYPGIGTPTAALLFKCNNVPFEHFKKIQREKFAESFPKTKIKLTQICGRFFWQDMSDEEFDRKYDQVVIRKQGIHTKEQLEQFVSDTYNEVWDISENVPYRYYYIENYSEDTSYQLVIGHHAFTDAIQLMGGLMTMSDNFDPSKYKNISGMSPWKQTLGYLISPIYALKLGAQQLLWPFDRNSFKKSAPEAASRHLALSDDFDRGVFHKACKANRCSFSEGTFAIIGQAIYDYQRHVGDSDTTEQMKFGTTFNLSRIPMKARDVNFGNNFVPMILPIRTSDNLNENIKHSRQVSQSVMGSLDLLGQRMLMKLLLLLPFNLSKQILQVIQSKRTFQYSSVPGPRFAFNIDGLETRGIYGLLPFVGEQPFGITACSCDNSVLYCLVSDSHYMQHPKLFMQFLERRMREFMTSGQPATENRALQAQKTSGIMDHQQPSMQDKKELKISKL